MTTHLEEGLFLNFSVVTMLRTISSLLGPVPEGAPPPRSVRFAAGGRRRRRRSRRRSRRSRRVWVRDIALEAKVFLPTNPPPKNKKNCYNSSIVEANLICMKVLWKYKLFSHSPCRHGISQEIKHTRCCESLLRIQHQ